MANQTTVSLGERALRAYARHAPLAWGKYRLVNALWRRFSGQSHVREAKLVYAGLRVDCDLGELIQRQLYFFGTYQLERDFLAVWQGLARQSKVIFDVGANAGIYSLAASAANSSAQIHAFEPTPEIAARLRRARDMNDLASIVVAEMAVSDTDGEANLVHCDGGADNGGMNFIVPSSGSSQECIVPTTSLDRYCRDNAIDSIDLIKIDVQGLEAAVFRGARGLLQDGKIGTVFVELNWEQSGGDGPASAVVDMLDSFGFIFSAISHSPQWRRAGPWLRQYSDVMAMRVTPAAM